MECVELAPPVRCVARFDSGSKLHALHTLRAVWFRLRRAEDRRALPAAVTEALLCESRECPTPRSVSICGPIVDRNTQLPKHRSTLVSWSVARLVAISR